MQTMKNKVDRKLAKTWLGKSLIRVGQKVDEVWMGVGQYLVRSWSAFKAKGVGQKLDESWMEFGRKKVQQGYNYGTTFLKDRVCQGYANGMPEFRSKRLLQLFSNTSPEIDEKRLRQGYTNPTPEIKRFSLEWLSQQLPIDYPENKSSSLDKSGQNQDEIGTENCVNASSRIRQFGAYQVGQLLGETCMDLEPFYLEMNLVIQPLSFIAHSFIADNKRVQDKWLDVPELFLYVVLPDQNL